MVHGSLSPDTILVMHDNSPVIIGLGLSEATDGGERGDARWSDAHALCKALAGLFTELEDDWQARSALNILSQGQMQVLDATEQLEALARSLSNLRGKSASAPPAPPARYWD